MYAVLSSLALLFAFVGSLPPSVAFGAEVAVVPGGVVRWSGSDAVEQCRLGERVWAPRRDGACFYPVDLLAPEAPLKVVRVTNGKPETRTVQVKAYPYAVQYIELEDDSKVNLSAEDLTRVRRESKEIRALWPLETTDLSFQLPLGPPLEPLPEGGRFGARRFINGQPRNPHSGVDYGAAAGTTVLSVADGRVVLTDNHFFAGNSVFIDHGDGLISMYFHLSEILVSEQQTVERGEPIAKVGSSGRATGPHLHFGLRWHGKRVDPSYLLADPEALPNLP